MAVNHYELGKQDAAPRVSLAQIEGSIESEHYFTAADGVAGARDGMDFPEGPHPLGLLTFCVLVLKNGFTVTGQSACASPKNFDAELGQRIARENAVRQIWPLLGYELRTKLSQSKPVPETTYMDRMKTELLELVDHQNKLDAFVVTEVYHRLGVNNQMDLLNQRKAMQAYARALQSRIDRATKGYA